MKIYVKYCGGCNPRYDKALLVSKLKSELEGCTFSETYDDPDVSLIVCGCASACADKSDAAAPYGMFTIWQMEGAESFKTFVMEAQAEMTGSNNEKEGV